jgi:hypothetical protein
MSNAQEIHCYEYVTQPYDKVGRALIDDGVGIFARATSSATSRARALVSTLHVSIGGFEVGKDVIIDVKHVDTHASAPGHIAPEATQLDLEWRAETSPALFPKMHATLTAYPLSQGETQLDLRGTYEPPLGVLGSVADRAVGHRIAEASVHAFLDALARRLNDELA